MAIITITRGLHSGGEELAAAVASQLGARCVSREVLVEAGRRYNVSEEKLEAVFEKAPSLWERMTESRRIYLAYLQVQLAEWASSDSLVYHGNAGQELLREAPTVLKVRVMYPIERRVQIIMQRFGYSREQAARHVEQIDDERTKRTRYFYNVDWRDSRRYDVTFNIDRMSADCVVDSIVAMSRRPEFTMDEGKREVFNDFLLKCRVYALLAGALVGRLSLITVTVSQGLVRLQGTLTSNESLIEDLVGQIKSLPGAKGVQNEIVVGLVYQEWNV
jgi:cytidylate kinase